MELDRVLTYPFGIHTAQSWGQVAAYLEMIEACNVGLFIEIGVDQGGLAAVMLGRAFINPRFHYLGLEIHPHVVNPLVTAAAARSDRTRIVFGDCMTPGISSYVASEIRHSASPVLLLCDNGNKPAEMKLYCELLRPGDWLTVHDFGTEFLVSDIPVFVDEHFARDLDYENVGIPLWQRSV